MFVLFGKFVDSTDHFPATEYEAELIHSVVVVVFLLGTQVNAYNLGSLIFHRRVDVVLFVPFEFGRLDVDALQSVLDVVRNHSVVDVWLSSDCWQLTQLRFRSSLFCRYCFGLRLWIYRRRSHIKLNFAHF